MPRPSSRPEGPRQFRILSTDPHRRAIVRTRHPRSWSQGEQRGTMIREIRDILHRAVEQERKSASDDIATSHWRY